VRSHRLSSGIPRQVEQDLARAFGIARQQRWCFRRRPLTQREGLKVRLATQGMHHLVYQAG
jgi:hypothetical protein